MRKLYSAGCGGPDFYRGRNSGVVLRSGNDPVLHLENPPGVDRQDRRSMLDALGKLNQRGFEKFGDPDIQTRISQYEMAFRMQASVPELTDLSHEKEIDLGALWGSRKNTGLFCFKCSSRPPSSGKGSARGPDHAPWLGFSREFTEGVGEPMSGH